MANGRSVAWLGITIVAIVVVAFAARSCSGPEAAPSVDTKANELDPTPAATATIARDEATRREANEAPPVPPIESWLDHPYEFELAFFAVAPLGLPRQHVTPVLSPHDLPLNLASVRTGVDGRTTVQWRSRSASADIVVCTDQGVLRRITLRHGTPTTLAVCGASTSIGASRGVEPGLHPFAVFAADAAPVLRAPGEGDFQFGITGPGSFGIAPHFRGRAQRAIEGVVFTENGSAAKGETVWLFGADPTPLANTCSDDDGRFVFEDPEPGTLTVRAGGDATGLGTTTAIVTNGTTNVRIDLHRDTYVRGRVVRSDGESPGGYRVTFAAEDGPWCDETVVAADGSFVLANLPTPIGNVVAFAPMPDSLPVAFALHAVAGCGELLLRHDVTHERCIRLDVDVPDECKEATVEMRVWNVDAGVGAFVHPPKPGERWTVGPLGIGWYRLEVRAPGCGLLDVGRVWLDGNADVDLGRVVMPRPSRVRFVIPDDVVPVMRDERVAEIYEVRSDFDVRVPIDDRRAFIDARDAIGDVPRARPVFLPAGNYTLAYRHRDGTVKFVRFTTRSGEDTVVTAQ